jgi:hypothetical protein
MPFPAPPPRERRALPVWCTGPDLGSGRPVWEHGNRFDPDALRSFVIHSLSAWSVGGKG